MGSDVQAVGGHRGIGAAGACVSGAVFGVGLAVSGMVDPRKVIGFLDLTGAWDASLMFVMGGAVAIAALGFGWARRHDRALDGESIQVPAGRSVDPALVVGAAIFGVGWGLAGYCPGPAIASIGWGNPEAWIFVPSMVAGVVLHRAVMAWRRRASASA